MDKYEYKLRLEEIKTLNRKGRFQEAAQVADTVDWKKVRNVSTLGIISDVYKVNRRFEDAKEILLLANEQSPQNRRILYSLCDLTVKMGQVVEAVEYYKEFVQLAPNDNSKYILLYKIYEAQDISLDERIAVLKEYKKREYSEKWAYELAFLYHRVGLATECVEECDQLILWFGEGKYVAKAMELKMRYVPLSPAQQQAYDRMFGKRPGQEEAAVVKTERQTAPKPAKVQEETPGGEELEIQVKPMDMGKYNTMNLQAALAESMREVWEPKQPETAQQEGGMYQPGAGMQTAAPVQSGYGGDDAEYQEDLSRVMQDSAGWDVQATGQLDAEEAQAGPEAAAESVGMAVSFPQPAAESQERAAAVQNVPTQSAAEPAAENAGPGSAAWMGGPGGMDALLAQEYDGQISMALTEEKTAEKQITGQMNIEDVLAEWEKLKRKNEEKRKQETRQWMLQQTGSLFDDFDQLSRDGVLEKLQREESLPIEDVQRRRSQEQEFLPEVEELEEIEAVGPQQEDAEDAAPVARPMPANAAARAVMAAQGVMEDMPAGKEEETEAPMQRETGQLAETEKKRLAIEALMREAEAKQREAQALLMQLERERLALMQSMGGQPADDGTAQPAEQPAAEAAREPVPQENAEERPEAESVQAAAKPQPLAEMAPAQAVEEAVQKREAAEQQGNVAPEAQTPQQSSQPEGQDRENGQKDAEQDQEGGAENAAVTGNTAALSERIREQQLEEHERNMTQEERELFAPFVATKGAMRQLVKALDVISLSAYTGNMIITGAPGSDMIKMAKSVIKKLRVSDRNFSGKLAKISADVLNTRNVDGIVAKLPNGALIIEKGGKLSDEGAANLTKALNQEQTGIIIFLLDSKRAVASLMDRCPQLAECFTARFDIAALDTGTLVKYGCQYAYNLEFSIDELGRLALHTRIEDMQTRDHAVTVEEVREIIEEAIAHAERFSIRHFVDILLRRRYDEDDMIILRERDFI